MARPCGTGGEQRESFIVITTEPDAKATPVPDRRPVLLEGGGIRRWLAAESAPESLAALLRPCPDEDLTRYPVEALVGSPRNDVPQRIVALAGGFGH